MEDADGSGRRQLLPPVQGRNFNPLDRRLGLAWSSDGEWIVFEEDHADHARPAAFSYIGIRAVRADGSDEHELYSVTIPPDGVSREMLMPARWASYGGGVPAYVMLAPPGQRPAEAGGLPLRLMALLTRSQEGSGVRLLTYREFLAASPDGQQLALVAGVALQSLPVDPSARNIFPPVDGQTGKSIVLTDLKTGEARTLTDGAIVAVSPSWSPDGQFIAFVARPDTGPVSPLDSGVAAEMPRRIWAMASDGSNARQLRTDGADCRQERPLWSADGAHILFACVGSELTASLWLVPASGGAAVEVVGGISPEPQAARSMLAGYRGHIDWDLLYDWWRPGVRAEK